MSNNLGRTSITMTKQLLTVIWILAAAVGASAQVVINEFSASNYTLGVNGDNEDFIEFYNEGPSQVDLEGYFLSDNPDNPEMFEIPAGTTINSGGYLLVICSNEGEVPENLYVGGNLNTNFKITQTMGESLVFSDPNGNVLESYTFYEDWTPTQADTAGRGIKMEFWDNGRFAQIPLREVESLQICLTIMRLHRSL